MDTDLKGAINTQVPLARAAALIVLTVGVSILLMISGAPYTAFIEGQVGAIPGTEIKVPLPILLVLGPIIVSVLQTLSLQQYKGLSDTCAMLRSNTAVGDRDVMRAQLPNDPVVQWQMAPDKHGRLACFVALTSLLILPFLLIVGMGLSALPFQNDQLSLVHLLVSLISLVSGAVWCWCVRRDKDHVRGSGCLSIIVLSCMLGVLVLQACLVQGPVPDFTDPPDLVCLPHEVGFACKWRLVRASEEPREKWGQYRRIHKPIDEDLFCRYSGLGCRAPNLSHQKLGSFKIDPDKPSENKDDTRIKLHHRSLRFAEMSAAKLPGADLTCSDLRGARLFNADLSHAVLQRTSLNGAGLTSANFRHAYLRQLDLRGHDLRGNDFSRAVLHDVSLVQADLRGTNFTRANIASSSPEDVDTLMKCDPKTPSVVIVGADLRLADLRSARLVAATLNEVKLNNADLAGADLRGVHLKGADLTGANLAGANLTGADLRSAKLDGATLQGAILLGADLREASLPKDAASHIKGAITTESPKQALARVALALKCEGGQIKAKAPKVWAPDDLLHQWLSEQIADCIAGTGEPALEKDVQL